MTSPKLLKLRNDVISTHYADNLDKFSALPIEEIDRQFRIIEMSIRAKLLQEEYPPPTRHLPVGMLIHINNIKAH